MGKNFLNSFEEITEIYGAFPLKKNFLAAGGQKLNAYAEDVVSPPAIREGRICFTLAVSYCFDDVEKKGIAWEEGYDVETADEAMAAVPELVDIVDGMDVTITLREETGRYFVQGVEGKWCVLDHERKPADMDPLGEGVTSDYAFEMIEAFLDGAVDAE